mgnify:CR=1 FL=1
MIRELKISNLALIEELHIEFEQGLTVLTGETGAGKSIILQSIHLLSGGRASVNWIRSGAESATVEALFDCSQKQHVLEAMRDYGFQTDGDIIVKRIIATGGKSRFYINGSLSTAKTIAGLSELLIEVASQHEHQQLMSAAFQLDFIDSVADLMQQRREFSALYEHWTTMKRQLRDLQEKERDKEQRRDFLSYQVQEIEEAKVVPGEDEELVEQKDRLKSSTELKRLGSECYQALAGPVTEELGIIRKNLDRMAELDRTCSEITEKVAEHSFQLEDCLVRLRDYMSDIPVDHAQLENITERIDVLQQLKRKYGPSLEEVIEFGDRAAHELAEIEEMDQRLAEYEQKLSRMEEELVKHAKQLSAGRRAFAKKLSRQLQDELSFLCLEQSVFEVRFSDAKDSNFEHMTRTGWDKAEFVFSANPGEAAKPLNQVASGGELSRLMLALKCILARKDQVETIVFDEIDAGISGKTAETVARKIKELAGHHQVLCITHLPQIASFADEHFVVSKQVEGQRTKTLINSLSVPNRVEELARMLDGDSVTDQTRAYVTELISRNQ